MRSPVVRPSALAPALILATALTVAGCSSGPSATVRGHEQAVMACTAARDSGSSSVDALLHSHQAAGLDPAWSALATAFGQVGVLRQSFGTDLGAGEDDTTGASALATISSTCATLGITVSATAAQTANPLP